MRNLKLSAQNVVAVADERWSPVRGFVYSDLTEKIFGVLEKRSLPEGGGF